MHQVYKHVVVGLKGRIMNILVQVFTICATRFNIQQFYPGADKALARPGRKQARKYVRDARDFNNIETRAVVKFVFNCKERSRKKFTPF